MATATKLSTAAEIQAAAARYPKQPAARRADRDEIELHFLLPENSSAKWLIPAANLMRGIAAEVVPGCRERYAMWPVLEGRDVLCMMKRDNSSILVWVRQGMDLELGPEWAAHLRVPPGMADRAGWQRCLMFEFKPKLGITLEMLVGLLEAAARADAGGARRIPAEERFAAAIRVQAGADAAAVATEVGATVTEVRKWAQVARRAALEALETD